MHANEALEQCLKQEVRGQRDDRTRRGPAQGERQAAPRPRQRFGGHEPGTDAAGADRAGQRTDRRERQGGLEPRLRHRGEVQRDAAADASRGPSYRSCQGGAGPSPRDVRSYGGDSEPNQREYRSGRLVVVDKRHLAGAGDVPARVAHQGDGRRMPRLRRNARHRLGRANRVQPFGKVASVVDFSDGRHGHEAPDHRVDGFSRLAEASCAASVA